MTYVYNNIYEQWVKWTPVLMLLQDNAHKQEKKSLKKIKINKFIFLKIIFFSWKKIINHFAHVKIDLRLW